MCYAPTNDVEEIKKGQIYIVLQLGKRKGNLQSSIQVVLTTTNMKESCGNANLYGQLLCIFEQIINLA